MKRLKDTPPDERAAGSEAGVELLASLKPLEQREGGSRPIPEPWAERTPARGLRRRAAPRWALAAAMLGVVGVAGAAMVRAGWLHPPAPPPSTHPTVEKQPTRPSGSVGRGIGPTVATPEAPPPATPRSPADPAASAAPATVASLPPPATAPAAPATREPPTSPTTARSRAAPSRRAASSQESQLFLSAWTALRTADDPATSRAALAEYLRRYPRGSLVEEAHGLAIEAASRLHDPDAARLAARYLRRFPRGRYAGLARAALAATP